MQRTCSNKAVLLQVPAQRPPLQNASRLPLAIPPYENVIMNQGFSSFVCDIYEIRISYCVEIK